MATTYDNGDPEINGRIKTVIAEYFPDLLEAGVKVKVLFAVSDEPPAIRHNGYAADAQIKINNLAHRTLGNGDALMIMDKRAYDELTSDRQRDALIHHELHHLIVKRDKESNDILRDDLNRPRLGMRKHDFQIGFFKETARVYGKDAPEVLTCRWMVETGGELLFPFMLEKTLSNLPAAKKNEMRAPQEKPPKPPEEPAEEDSEKGTTDGKPTKKKAKKKAKAKDGELELVK
jgi:hypothetical protein